MRAENKLVRRFFWIILLTIAVMFVAVHFFSVPLIKKQVFEIERNSARLALNNIFQLASKMYSSVQVYREQVIESRSQSLKAVVEVTESQIRQAFAQAEEDGQTVATARQQIFESLRKVQYGSGGYIWISDYNAMLLTYPERSHTGEESGAYNNPDSKQQGLRLIINNAIAKGESYYQHTVEDALGETVIHKISYAKSYPRWGFVIGSDLYLDDLEQEVEVRKQAAISELRDALINMRIAKTGYLFVFDEEGNMLVHPNPNIDRTNAETLKNPTGNSFILADLRSVSDTGGELHYKWDKPSDPNNYVYDKIALVRSLKEFGWYIGSSVYIDELRSSAAILSERILTIALISILIALSAATFFIGKIFQPIQQLVKTARRINQGDLTAKSEIYADDEIGLLANAFDSMVDNLRNNIETLDHVVKLRTRELAEVEERQRLILDALPAQVAYLDKDLRYVFVNKGYADIFHMKKDVIVGQMLRDVVGDKMMRVIDPDVQVCLKGKKVVYEYSFIHEGKELITKRTMLPDFNEQGEIIGLLNLSLDVTAEKEAEKRLTEAHRINAAGQIAGGLAHDFNNLLSIILGNLQVIKERYSSDALEKYIEPAIRASLCGADITERLLTFSRHQALHPTAIEPKRSIENAVQLVKSSLPKNIHVDDEVSSSKAIYVDSSQMENALVNLLLNARDAMADGGNIRCSVRDMNVVDDSLIYDEQVAIGEYVELAIHDTGHGFTEDSQTKACEPFYTTKPHGKGSGLGLSMVYGFTKQSQGYMDIHNNPSGGATVSLLLPAYSNETLAIEDVDSINGPNCRVEQQLFLLVEDNDDVRAVIREQLVQLGHSVLEAKDSDEAESLILSLPHLDGLVSDINMPGKFDGFELAALMRDNFPLSCVVLITGYIYGQEDLGDKAKWCIIRKPFGAEALVDAINQSVALN